MEPSLNEIGGHNPRAKGYYTFSMSRVAVIKGYGSVLRIPAPRAEPPYLTHRFYVAPAGSAHDALREDFRKIIADLLTVVVREAKDGTERSSPQ